MGPALTVSDYIFNELLWSRHNTVGDEAILINYNLQANTILIEVNVQRQLPDYTKVQSHLVPFVALV